MDQPKQVVWVLGAGFSHSLGGPQLKDLLSAATNARTREIYKDNPYIGRPDTTLTEKNLDARLAAEKLRQLVESNDDSSPARRLWSDAEEFLGDLDAAAHGRDGRAGPSVAEIRFRAATGINDADAMPMWLLRDSGRRLVAGSCCAFLRDAVVSQERWDPYLTWAKAMGTWDSMVTFNYDRVLEVLDAFEVVAPNAVAAAGKTTKAEVFKLHGSVDWQRQGKSPNARYVPIGDREFALGCDGPEIGIATPGPTKRVATGELRVLWAEAMTRLKRADAVVFVGYRFPPSDAEARTQLLGALALNLSPRLKLHVVLGPERGPDVVRLEELLRYMMHQAGREETRPGDPGTSGFTFRLTTHHLFAEDFFTVWHRKLLWA